MDADYDHDNQEQQHEEEAADAAAHGSGYDPLNEQRPQQGNLLLKQPQSHDRDPATPGEKKILTEEKKRFLKNKENAKILKKNGKNSSLLLKNMKIVADTGNVEFKGKTIYSRNGDMYLPSDELTEFRDLLKKAIRENQTNLENQLDDTDVQNKIQTFRIELDERRDQLLRKYIDKPNLTKLLARAETENSVDALEKTEKDLLKKKSWLGKSEAVNEMVAWVQDKAELLRVEEDELPVHKRNQIVFGKRGLLVRLKELGAWLRWLGIPAGVVYTLTLSIVTFTNTLQNIQRTGYYILKTGKQNLNQLLTLIGMSEYFEIVAEDEEEIENNLKKQKLLAERIQAASDKRELQDLKIKYDDTYLRFGGAMKKLEQDKAKLQHLLRLLKIDLYRREFRKSELRTEILALKHHIESKNVATQKELAEMRSKVQDYDKVNEDNAILTKQIQRITTARAKQTAEIDNLKHDLEEKQKELNAQMGGADYRNPDTKKELDSLKIKLALAEKNRDEVQKEYQESLDKIREYETTMETQKTKIEDLSAQILTARQDAEKKSLQEKQTVAIEKYTALGEKLTNMQQTATLRLERLVENNTKLQKDVERLRGLETSKRKEIATVDAEIAKLKGLLEGSEETEEKKELLQKQRDALQKQRDELQKNYDELKSSTDQTIQSLTQNKESLDEKVAELDTQVQTLKGEKTALKTQLDAEKQKVGQLKSEKEAVEEDLKKFEQDLTQAKQNLNKAKNDKSSDVKELNEKIEELEQAKKEKAKNVVSLQTEVDELKKSRDEKTEDVKNLEQKVTELEKNLQAQKTQTQTLNNALAAANQNVQKYQKELAEASGNLQKVDGVNDRLQELQTENLKLQDKVSELTHFKTAAVINMNVLDQEKKTLKDQTSEQKQKLDREIADNKKEIGNINMQLRVAAGRLKSTKTSLAQTESRLRKDLESAMQKIREKEKEIQHAKQQVKPAAGGAPSPNPSGVYTWLQGLASAGGWLGWVLKWILKIIWMLTTWLLAFVYWLIKNVMTVAITLFLALVVFIVVKIKNSWNT